MVTGGSDLNTGEETNLIEKAFSGDKKNRKALLLEENNIESMTKTISGEGTRRRRGDEGGMGEGEG